MDILDQHKILIFIFFCIPGFVALKTYDFFYSVGKKEIGKEIIDALFFSCLNYAVVGFPLIYFIDKYVLNIGCLFFLGVLTLLICPCFLAFVWVCLVNWVSKNFQAGK